MVNLRLINKSFVFLIIVGFSYFPNVQAQTACPVGVGPGSPQCGPDSGTSRGDIAPPKPTGKWIKTWGALAANSAGDIGLSSGKVSKEDAATESVLRCEEYEAGECVAKHFFYNQCISVARANSGKSATVTGPKEKAPTLALKECERSTGSSCIILVTECSNPIFEKY
ncbi:DUF4189 domain-containing protein [Xanthomonas nasturtii]|uniref:DUF4189 domain-containing protein n=2 Tax=Xanthomonas nasturtii TaxID=1843581 RepID=A0ABT0LUP7_9XANT|nr:DUF4189 domain-containing protein [Xanthomonas nasturtii]MCL1501274.1 DUF4189 domain-containing protein [Xanthomonas nasturtii]MCL1505081.1 DUF4189 domain-containing protein [Xanthomonas nasturtii]MCL1552857.1 DUF4189 domain-containing protein [Xanthomonas nasturtii]MCL1557015.1 DUF4189 domain-containing protein [Xanthomonas nasturtii]